MAQKKGMKAVVDTSILIDYVRGGSRWEHFIAENEEDTELYLPSIVVFELFSGKSTRDPKHAQEIIRFLKHFHIIELTEEIARRAGELYRDVKKTINVPDYIIAASALQIGASVVTLNQKHFEHIPGLRLFEEVA